MFENFIGIVPWSRVIGVLAPPLKSFQVINLAKNATDTTNPALAIVKGVALLVDVCSPPQVKYPLKCVVMLAQYGIVLTSSGPISFVMLLSTIQQILLEEINGK
jgi:hypothetical protein